MSLKTDMKCPECKKDTPIRRKLKFHCVHCGRVVYRPKEKIICPICGDRFETWLYNKSEKNNQKFCSVNCRVKNHQKKKEDPNEAAKRKLVNKLHDLSLEQLGEVLKEFIHG